MIKRKKSRTKAAKTGQAPRLGTGVRFHALEEELAGRPGVFDPAGLAAWIGRRKYGAKKMRAWSKSAIRRKKSR